MVTIEAIGNKLKKEFVQGNFKEVFWSVFY